MMKAYDFDSAIEELERCGFECQAGPLENAEAWRWLKGREVPVEALSALRVGHDEIVRLRRQVDELAPKAHAYETIAIQARLTLPREGGYAQEDPLWRMKAIVEAAEKRREEAAAK
jgi:hypothetical protein